MEKKKEYAVSYYGGHVTAWLCVAAAILGIMYLLLGRGGGTKSMMVALFFTLVLGLVLAKDRKAYGEEMLAGLRESMFCVICVAFFMAGLLSSLLKTSGLIQALIWVVAELHVNTGFIPVVAFLICVVISTACGTSTGTVTAVSAVMCPLAGELGIDMGLMCGAVVSGSIFGAFAARRGAEIEHLLPRLCVNAERGKLAGKPLHMEKPFFECRARGGRTGKLHDQRPRPGAGRHGMALLLQKRGQGGIVRAQCVDADRRLRLFIKCGGQGERLCPELRIEKLGHRAGQAVVDREPVQRVGKISLGDIKYRSTLLV